MNAIPRPATISQAYATASGILGGPITFTLDTTTGTVINGTVNSAGQLVPYGGNPRASPSLVAAANNLSSGGQRSTQTTIFFGHYPVNYYTLDKDFSDWVANGNTPVWLSEYDRVVRSRDVAQNALIAQQNLRVAAENDRDTEHNLRVTAENDRDAEHNLRVTAENDRDAEHNLRVAAENDRDAEHNLRVTAENDRDAEHNLRVTAENASLGLADLKAALDEVTLEHNYLAKRFQASETLHRIRNNVDEFFGEISSEPVAKGTEKDPQTRSDEHSDQDEPEEEPEANGV